MLDEMMDMGGGDVAGDMGDTWADRGMGVDVGAMNVGNVDVPNVDFGGDTGEMKPQLWGTKDGYNIYFDPGEWNDFFARSGNIKANGIKTLMDMARIIADQARANAPVDTGQLRDSITVQQDSDEQVSVIAGAPYSACVEFGTRPHVAPIDALEGWAERHGMSAGQLWWTIKERGTQPHPYMGPAIDSTYTMLDGMTDSIWDETFGGPIGRFLSNVIGFIKGVLG